MLPSQRALFEMPRHVCYLNAASYSPLPLRTQEAGRAAVGRNGTPWTLEATFANDQHERARAAAARLINADPASIALIPSVSYGVATAAKLLTIDRGTRVIVLDNDHSSPVLEWQSRSDAQGFTVETIHRSDDGDWTSAVLAAIERSGAPPVSLASISSVHWSDGGLIDVEQVGVALRQRRAKFLIDATQSAGVLTTDVKRLDPDFVIFPTYKWLLGPYGRAFLYVAERHQGGIPLEQTSAGRRNVRAENAVYFADPGYVVDARRFDMGERDHFISMEMASIGMEMMAEWGASAVAQRLKMLTERIAEGLRGIGVSVPESRVRAPHILSIGFKDGMPAGLVAALATEGVYVAPRLGRLRVSPHVYNDEDDADRFVASHPLRLLRPRHRKPLIALRRNLVADLTVWPDAADIRHENPRLAGDVGAHVPGIGLRVERGVGDLVDVGDPAVLGFLLRLHGVEAALAQIRETVGDPVDMLLDRDDHV
jgi:selenocysteine lyase/cysteine desulfurase